MRRSGTHLFALLLLAACSTSGTDSNRSAAGTVPEDVQRIFDKPAYEGAVWGLRVLDAQTGEVLIDREPQRNFFIGSVRKVFSVGELLEAVGPDFTYDTPVHRQGEVGTDGVLQGDLILVASGDLTMGGRKNPDGSIAVSNFDHNEADSLGNAVLTAPDPLAGYDALAQQVAAAGITRVTGEVVIDDRLFQPFNFREQFDVRPIFVNDDVVDLTIHPTTPGSPANVSVRPVSQALTIDNQLTTGPAGSDSTLTIDPELPDCIGQPGCTSTILGSIPVDFVPPLTNALPLVQTVRIVQPSNYARTVFIEALGRAGVTVDAPAVEQNPTQLLPAKGSFTAATQVAELKGMTYAQDAKLILKVSYNIGADTSLVLWGLTRGVDNMQAALQAERQHLTTDLGIPGDEFHFVDGSGGGDTTATTRAVTTQLADLRKSQVFPAFFDALPILGVDGSLSFVTDFESDPTLAGARGQVHAKTGTFLTANGDQLLLKGQALGGFIEARSGRELIFQLVVNDVPVEQLQDAIAVFQDQGTIAAVLWRDL